MENLNWKITIIMICVIMQTIWAFKNQIPEVNASSGIITDVNIVQIDGQRINSPYVPPISVKIK